MVFLRKTVILETLSVFALKRFLITNIELREKMITVPNKSLFSVLSYLRVLLLQARAKFKKSFKGILNSCKLQIVIKSKK